jgi:hypothetical protein
VPKIIFVLPKFCHTDRFLYLLQEILCGGEGMTIVMTLLHRYVAPFLMGVCMAATTVVSDIPSMVALLCVAGASGFFSLPAGGRLFSRFTDTVV